MEIHVCFPFGHDLQIVDFPWFPHIYMLIYWTVWLKFDYTSAKCHANLFTCGMSWGEGLKTATFTVGRRIFPPAQVWYVLTILPNNSNNRCLKHSGKSYINPRCYSIYIVFPALLIMCSEVAAKELARSNMRALGHLSKLKSSGVWVFFCISS